MACAEGSRQLIFWLVRRTPLRWVSFFSGLGSLWRSHTARSSWFDGFCDDVGASMLAGTGAATTGVILAAVVRVSSTIATLAVPSVEVGAETAVEETSARNV